MAFDKSVSFYNQFSETGDGNIAVKVTDTDAATGPFNIFISITGPNGIVHQSDGITPELVLGDNSTGSWDIPIPLDDDGNYLAGEYRVTIDIWDSSPVELLESSDGTYAYEPIVVPGSSASSIVDFTAEVSCITGLITCTDNTSTSGYYYDESYERLITVVPPAVTEQSAVTGTEASLDAPFSFENCTYDCSLVITRIGLPVSDGTIQFNVWEKISKTISLPVHCATTGCGVAECMEAEFDTLNDAACNGGGWGELTNRQKARLEYADYLETLSRAYERCGNLSKSAAFANRLKDFLNCGCDCDDTDQPKPYTSPCND